MARVARQRQLNECRQCSTFCDRVIKPSSCVASDCPALYQYDDPLTGRRYMGCLHKVFATEIDIELFQEAEQSRSGFGVVKLARGGARSLPGLRSPRSPLTGARRKTAAVKDRLHGERR